MIQIIGTSIYNLLSSAYNTGYHSTINISPFELTFGRKANLPIDSPPTTFNFPQVNDYFYQLVQNLKHYHAAVKDNIQKQQRQAKIRYDTNRLNPQYDIGSTVLNSNFYSSIKIRS